VASAATRHRAGHGAAAALNHGYSRAFLVIAAVAAADVPPGQTQLVPVDERTETR
jgi:hypothetical protein